MANKNEAKIKFTAETEKLNQEIKESINTMSLMRSELKLNSEEMKSSGVNLDGLEKKHSLLQQSLEASQDKTELLNKKLEIAKSVFGENSNEALKWQNTLNNALASQERLKRAIQECSQEINEQKRSEESAKSGIEILTTEIKNQESELTALKREYANAIIEQGKESDEAKNLKTKISELSQELSQNKEKMSQASNAAEDAASSFKNLGDSEESAKSGIDDVSSGYTVAKDVFADFASQALQATIDKFKELSIESEASIDKMNAKIGASGQEASKYKDVVMDVYGDCFGETVNDCTEALGTVVQMTDNLNKKDLKNVTENVMTLCDVYDMDYAESMRAVNSLTDQFKISQDQAFNLISQGAREGLNQNGDLLDVINEYSVQFANSELSADDMFNMIKNGAAEGVWSIDKMGDAYKEFNIRMSDGTANEYLKKLGLNADDVVAKFQNGGDDAKEAMKQISDAIQNCDDKTLAYQSGVGIMGTMWEDMGQDACLALLNTEGSMDSLNDTMNEAKTEAYDNIKTSLENIGRTLSDQIMTPVSDSIGPKINDGLKYVNEHLDVIGPLILGVATALGVLAVALGISSLIKGVQSAFAALNLTMMANPIVWIIALIAGVVVAFTALWNHCDGFREFWTGLWDSITGWCSEKVEAVKEKIGAIHDKFTEIKDGIAEKTTAIKEDAAAKWGRIKSIYEENGGGLKGIAAVSMTGVKNAFKSGYDKLNTLTGGRLGDMVSTAKGKLDSFHDKFVSIKEKIKDIFNFKMKSPDIKMPKIDVVWHKEGKMAKAAQLLGLEGMPDFNITWHAKGAILTKPTIFGYANGSFQGGGEAGQEAILPISLLSDYIENGMMKFIAAIPQIDYDRLGESVANANSKRDTRLVINGREAGRIMEEIRPTR